MDTQVIQGSAKNKEELESKLSLLAPSKFLNSNSILDFERFKKVDIDWLELLNIDKNDEEVISSNFKTSIQLIQEYFFKYWDNKSSYLLFNVDSKGFEKVFNDLPLSDPEIADNYWKLAEIGFWSDKKQSVEYSTTNNIFCIIHHESERLYYFSNKKYPYFTKSDLETELKTTSIKDLSIQELWNKLDMQDLKLNVNICFEKLTDNTVNILNEKHFFSKNSSIDRSLIFLREEFFRLDNESVFLTKLKDVYEDYKIDPTSKAEVPNSSKLDDIAANYSTTLDQQQLNIAKQSYFDICNRYFDVEERRLNVIRRIEGNGIYKICLDENFKIISPTTKLEVTSVYNPKPKRGDIFQYVNKTYTVPYSYRREERYCTDPFNINCGYHYYDEIGYKLEDIPTPFRIDLTDPLEVFKDGKQKENIDFQYQYYTFIKTFEGYISENDGKPLAQILKRCEEDEEFRKTCVIITYEYDFILTEKKYPVDAKIFFAPLPTMFSQDIPELSIRETLAYRIAWEGAELGQLVNSINLAPGESRQISLSTSFTQNTTKSSSLKNTSDLNTTNSFDLSTELQNEATKEISKTDSFSANVSGSYGGIVSGGASGSTTSSVKTFTRDMSKLARKTSASINRRLVSEVNESSSQSITVNESSSRTSSISNINQGSTLNLMIYQINNRYKSGLFLDELQMSITKKTELIPNSGLYEFKYYNFHNLDIYVESIIDNINPLLVEEICCCEKSVIAKKLAEKINNTIYEDYAKEGNVLKLESIDNKELKDIHNSNEIENVFKKKRILQKFRNKKSNSYNLEEYQKELKINELLKKEIITDKVKEIYNSNTKEYCDNLKTKSLINKNLFEDEEFKQESYFTVNSGAFYIDSLVGINPATEKYSDDMRDLEKEKVTGKNNEQKIKNQLLQKELPYVTKISNENDEKRSIAHLSSKIKCTCFLPIFCSCSKHFKIYVDNDLIRDCRVKLGKDKYHLTIDWSLSMPSVDRLEKELEIIYKNKVIKYLP